MSATIVPFVKPPRVTPPEPSPLQLRTQRFIDRLQCLVLDNQNIAAMAIGSFDRVLDWLQRDRCTAEGE